MMANSGIPLSEWSGSGATRELHETIKQFNATAERQSAEMVALTRQLKWLTWAMLFAVVVQIYLAASGHVV
jgi:hypothetical protein